MATDVTLHESEIYQSAKEIVFGSTAGISGKLVEYPFDTVKVRLQSQPNGVPQFSGAIDCFRQTVSLDGWKGLYRGLSAPLAGAMAENALLFLSYSKSQSLIKYYSGLDNDAELPLNGIVLAGAMSGAITSFVLTPIELVKCRLQVQTVSVPTRVSVPTNPSVPQYNTAATAASNKLTQSYTHSHNGPLTLIRDIYHTKGLLGFWRGQITTMTRESGGSLAWFGVYEFVLQRLRPIGTRKRENTSTDTLTAGAAAGVAYNALLFPVDSVKSRLQTGVVKSSSIRGAVAELYQSHGIRGFYRGSLITVLRAAPSNALIFWVYEQLARNF